MMTTNTYAELALHPENAPHGATRPCPTAADATLEFGRFRVLVRHRQWRADRVGNARVRAATSLAGGRRSAGYQR